MALAAVDALEDAGVGARALALAPVPGLAVVGILQEVDLALGTSLGLGLRIPEGLGPRGAVA
eukprot:7155330-Alexandrium_andersonii.AAC.1